MTNEGNGEKTSNTKDIIQATTGLIQAIPIYQDVVQPAAKEIGKTLGTVAKTVNIALAPVSALVWGFDQMKDFIETKVAHRLKNVPTENIVTPKANIAGPAMDSLRYTGHEPALSDMYANLLASAMDVEHQDSAHPAFVEIIKQLTPLEARLLKAFAIKDSYPLVHIRSKFTNREGIMDIYQNYTNLWKICDLPSPKNTPEAINNLCRLGILEIPAGLELTDEELYQELETEEFVKEYTSAINELPEQEHKFDRNFIRPTPLGQQFIETCVSSTPIES